MCWTIAPKTPSSSAFKALSTSTAFWHRRRTANGYQFANHAQDGRTGHLWFQLVFVALIFDFQFWSLSGIIIFSDPNHIIHIIESASYFVRKPGIWRLLQGSGTRCRWISRGTGAHGRSDVSVNRWLSGTVWNNNLENFWMTCQRNMLSMYCCPGKRCELHVTRHWFKLQVPDLRNHFGLRSGHLDDPWSFPEATIY